MEIGVQHDPHTFKCISWNGFVVYIVLILIIMCLHLPWIHAVPIELYCKYPWMRHCRAVGGIWARWWCCSHEYVMLSGFLASSGNSVEGGLGDLVVWVHTNALSLFHCRLIEVDIIDRFVTVSAVAGDFIQGFFTWAPVIVINLDDLEHWPLLWGYFKSQ